MRRLVGSIGLMPLTFLIPPALWIKVRWACCLNGERDLCALVTHESKGAFRSLHLPHAFTSCMTEAWLS